MKVEQGQPKGFAPITITLETKEEADLMLSALEVPTSIEAYKILSHLSAEKVEDLTQQMWSCYEDVYCGKNT